MEKPRLTYVVTHPVSADTLLRGQLAFMAQRGFDVTLVAAPGPVLDRVAAREGIRTVPVRMEREIDPRADVAALAKVTQALARIGPHVVNASTPKAGLLGMIAARALRVPVRTYLLRGLRLETAQGLTRSILAMTERTAAACAHDVVCVSNSLMKRVADAGYASRGKLRVLASGSSNGVDVERFRRTDALVERGRRELVELGVAPGAPIVGFIGRLVEDKGVRELFAAFGRVRASFPAAVLVLVGGDLADQSGTGTLAAQARSMEGVYSTATVEDVAPFYAVMDVLALPSYREGFPNVVLEAAAMEVPVVGFRSTGVVDAIEDGVTGTIVEQRDVRGLADAITSYLGSSELAKRTGRRARERVEREFSRAVVWRAWRDFYRDRLEQRGLPLPA